MWTVGPGVGWAILVGPQPTARALKDPRKGGGALLTAQWRCTLAPKHPAAAGTLTVCRLPPAAPPACLQEEEEDEDEEVRSQCWSQAPHHTASDPVCTVPGSSLHARFNSASGTLIGLHPR